MAASGSKIYKEEFKKVQAAYHGGKKRAVKRHTEASPVEPKDRPTIYSEKLAAGLFDLISSGLSLEEIAVLPTMPKMSTLLKWRVDDEHPFNALYDKAKKALKTIYEERAVREAVNPRPTKVVTQRESEKFGSSTESRVIDNVRRSALALDAYKWALGWMDPKKHGRGPEIAEASAENLDLLLDEFRRRNSEVAH